MSVDRLYKDGDIVWVKLGNNWWPAEVTDGYRQPEGLLSQVKYEPYCVVKFFQEDTYEIVKSSRQIYPFKCNKKEEFIRKGLASHTAKNDFMEKFPSDVEIAERLTRRVVESDLLVINDRPYSILKAIIGQKLTITRNDNYESDIRPSSSEKRRSGDCVTKILNITPTRINASGENSSATKASTYRCNFCDFTSLRQNVMILHNKTHSSGVNNSTTAAISPRRSYPKPTNKTSPLPERDNPSNNVQLEKHINKILPITHHKDGVMKTNSIKLTTDMTANKNGNGTHKRKIRKEKNTSSPTAKTRAANAHYLSSHSSEPKTLSTEVVNKLEEEDLLPVYFPLRKSQRASPKVNAKKSKAVKKIETSTSPEDKDKDREDSKDNSFTTCNTVLDDLPTVDATTCCYETSAISMPDSEIAEPKRRPEDIMKSLQADWSDEEETSSANVVVSSDRNFCPEDKPSNAEVPNSLIKSIETDGVTTNFAVSTSVVTTILSSSSSSSSTSGRIRNIPKKDRRDIILKEFPPNENNCNSNSMSMRTMKPLIVDANISRSNSNSSEAVIVLGESFAAATVNEEQEKPLETSTEPSAAEQPAEDAIVCEPVIQAKKYYITTEVDKASSSPLTETKLEVDATKDLTDNIERTPLIPTEGTVLDQQLPSSPAVAAPTWSCFDFEEDNDSDVLTSIAIFKKKHLSPDKNSITLINSSNTENPKVTTNMDGKTEEATETESKDKQLSAEIESLLQQTKTTIADISTVAAGTREDVSVKALPIKERGKRIFKSRNRSRVEEALNVAMQTASTSSANAEYVDETQALTASENIPESLVSENEEVNEKIALTVSPSESDKNSIDENEKPTIESTFAQEDKFEGIEAEVESNTIEEIPSADEDIICREQQTPSTESTDEIIEATKHLKNTTKIVDGESGKIAENSHKATKNEININEEVQEDVPPINVESVVTNNSDAESIENSVADSAKDNDIIDNIERSKSLDLEEHIETIPRCSNLQNIEDAKVFETIDVASNERTESKQNDDMLHSSDLLKDIESSVDIEKVPTKTITEVPNVQNESVMPCENKVDESIKNEKKQGAPITDHLPVEKVNAADVDDKVEDLREDLQIGVQNDVEIDSAISVPGVDCISEESIKNNTSMTVEMVNKNHQPIDNDDIIPIIKHSPVEIYQEESNSDNLSKLESLGDGHNARLEVVPNEEESRINERSPAIGANDSLSIGSLGVEEDSLHEIKTMEQQLELAPGDRNTDMDNVENDGAASRLTSPTDENSSIGISEAGAEFGSPTSMLDDERLPIVTGNLMTDIERISDNLNEGPNETDVAIDKHIAECVRSLEDVADKTESDSLQPVWPIEAKDNIEHEAREENEVPVELFQRVQNEATLERSTLLVDIGEKIETEEQELSAHEDEEDEDDIESPPHEKLSGNELDEEEREEKSRLKQKIKTKNTPFTKNVESIEELSELDFGNVPLLEQQTMPETPPEERDEMLHGVTQPALEKDHLQVVEKIEKETTFISESCDNNSRSSAREKRNSADSVRDETVIQALAVNEANILEKIQTNEQAISCQSNIITDLIVEEPEAEEVSKKTMDQSTEIKAFATTVLSTESYTQERKLTEEDFDSRSPKPAEKTIELVRRKRRSHIKITPRKRTATETSTVARSDQVKSDTNCETDPKLRRKSDCLSNSTLNSSETVIEPQEPLAVQTDITINTPTSAQNSPRCSEIRSFRPRRKTNTTEAITYIKSSEKSFSSQEDGTDEIIEKFVIQTSAAAELSSASHTAIGARASSPVEKVRINVDVANPLSSQIANILATSGQQQRFGNQQPTADSPSQTTTNKKVNVSNLPVTTIVSKSTISSMKRKKSIEDDIPSFIIERPCMIATATAAEKEAFAHVQNKCPQVKITRKEKIIDYDVPAVVEPTQTPPNDRASNIEQSTATASRSLQSPTQMFILNPTPAKQQKLTENDATATLFDIGNMPILLTNEQLIAENVHIVISSPTATSAESLAAQETLLSADKSEAQQQELRFDGSIQAVITADGSLTTLQEEQLKTQGKLRKTGTHSRSKRLLGHQQSQQEQQSQQQSEQKLTAHQKQLQEQQQQQRLLQEQKQTSTKSNKQMGVDSRGNKYVIIKTPPSDLIVQQQHHELQQLQQHTVVGSHQPKIQTSSFDIGSSLSLQPVEQSSLPISPLETIVSEEIITCEQQPQQQQKQRSPAAAATGGRKYAGNTITLPSSLTVKQHQQQFNDAMHSASEAVADTLNNQQQTASTLAMQKNLTKSSTKGSSANNKNLNRANSTGNRRLKQQQQKKLPCLTQQEMPVVQKKLLTTKDQKAQLSSGTSNSRSTAINRLLSGAATEPMLPTKAAKSSLNHTFTGDVVIGQQQQQLTTHHSSQPPPLHHLSNRKMKKQQRRSSSQSLAVPTNTLCAAAQAGCSTSPQQQQLHQQQQQQQQQQREQQQQLQQQQQQQQHRQQQAANSTAISEEQLIQIQAEDQIDGTSKILAVPTQPIPGYNETFLLCTLVNNNYKPIDNVPLYLDHDLNQLVPVPLEALNGQPNLIVNHPAPEEMVNQQQHTSSPLHQRNNCNTAAANSTMAGGLKSGDGGVNSSNQMICLQTEGIETSAGADVVTNDGGGDQMVYIPPECGSEMPSDNAVILNIEGQQIILDAATFAHLLANPDANTQLITDDGTEFVLTREVLAALEAQQESQEEAAVEQRQQIEQQIQQTHQITEAGPTDILAVALAGTDLYGSEVLEIETSQGLQLVGADGIVFQTTGLPQAHLTPPITAQTSETNALLNQTPIMSTLEKPSTSGKRKPPNASAADLFAAAVAADNISSCRPNLDDSLAVIGVSAQSSTIPTSLELPITVTNPAIAPKSTMAGPTAPVGLSSTSTVVVTEAVQFQCLPHRTGLAGNDPEEDLNDDDEFGEDYFFNRAIN